MSRQEDLPGAGGFPGAFCTEVTLVLRLQGELELTR